MQSSCVAGEIKFLSSTVETKSKVGMINYTNFELLQTLFPFYLTSF